ncbi:hypothetical protein H8B09_25840 [Paenibacillus sp. PR3]|uniref:Beta-hydroxyacyl-ACP dehydratase n=1 Tax=Paenibacillus terricola TaxID=2763503 RepID=A0ABR8N6V5_9BACL|nr:hypothetical protein [Paenibacillus terricola]MBD3922204.1 hypothetical protein [Paenibacillus terricola]
MNLGLIDKVVSWTNGVEGIAVHNISMTNSFLDTHFPLKPIWPGVLTMTAVSRLAEGVIRATYDFEKRVKLTRVSNIKWRKYIAPGDQLYIEVKVLSMSEKEVLVRGKVKVNDKIAAAFGEMQFSFDDALSNSDADAKAFWEERGLKQGESIE